MQSDTFRFFCIVAGVLILVGVFVHTLAVSTPSGHVTTSVRAEK